MAEYQGPNGEIIMDVDYLPADDRDRGLYRKYDLIRVNEDGNHRFQVFTPFFVLRYDSDSHARAALVAYAESCHSEYPQLAADLISQVTNHGGL